MKNAVASLTAVVAAAGILVSFFMPWVIVDAELAAPVGVVGRKVDQVTGTTAGSAITNTFRKAVGAVAGRTKVAHMSGFEIARSERNEFLKFVSEITALFGAESKDPRKVRFLYLLPLAGLLLGYLVARMNGLLAKIAGGVSILIGGFMAFKLLTVPLGNEVAQAHLQWGIWATVGFFVLLGGAGLTKK